MTETRLPPGPPARFLVGHLPELRRGRLEFFTRCARDYGEIALMRLGPRVAYLLSRPEWIEHVLVNDSKNFTKHYALRVNPMVLGNGLLTSEGDFWLKQRRLIQPAFQKSRIASYAPIMVAYTQRMLAGWRQGEHRDIFADMMRLTLEIAAKTLFDAEAGSQAGEVGDALHVAQEAFVTKLNSILPIPNWVPIPRNFRMWRAVRRLDEIIYGFIRERRKSGETRNDLLSLLLAARDEQGQGGMSDRQLRDEAMTLFLAGHETTALTLSWSWVLLAQNSEAQEKLVEEVRQVLGDRPAVVEDLPRLVFTEQVVLEAMRLYPPAFTIGREALHDCEIGGYRVPAGTTLLMSQWVMQRDPRFWDKPEKFNPSRWSGDLLHRLPRFVYFPFGAGPRICIGNAFAMMETVLVLATIAQRFRFELEPGQVVVPAPTFTLRPKNGVPAILSSK